MSFLNILSFPNVPELTFPNVPELSFPNVPELSLELCSIALTKGGIIFYWSDGTTSKCKQVDNKLLFAMDMDSIFRLVLSSGKPPDTGNINPDSSLPYELFPERDSLFSLQNLSHPKSNTPIKPELTGYWPSDGKNLKSHIPADTGNDKQTEEQMLKELLSGNIYSDCKQFKKNGVCTVQCCSFGHNNDNYETCHDVNCEGYHPVGPNKRKCTKSHPHFCLKESIRILGEIQIWENKENKGFGDFQSVRIMKRRVKYDIPRHR